MTARAAFALALIAVSTWSARSARAQQTSQFLTNNDYRVELFQGPLLAPIRVTGIGGAYIALAEGVEGGAVNAAAPAVREAFSYPWFDLDIAAGISIPGAFARTDFDNRGQRSGVGQVGNFVDVNFGVQTQFGHFGSSLTGDLQQYELSPVSATSPGLTMQLGRWKGLAAYGLFRGQLVVGAGIRVVTMQIDEQERGTLFSTGGFGPEVGGLWMPDGRPWRIGATFRAPEIFSVVASERSTLDAQGVRRVGNFILPSEVIMPWEVELGFAYQLGPRPLNPPWINPSEQEAPVRDAIEASRDQREIAYARELARTPPNEQYAKRAEQRRIEKMLREAEDERLEAEKKRLEQVRKARYQNWPREKILLLASLLMTARTGEGQKVISIEGFLDQNREHVGNAYSFTPRFGIEGEPIKNRMRGRVGTYIEPSRYDHGTARQHFTFGGDVKLFPFDAWGILAETTWRVSFFVDVAPRYMNGGIGIGAWH